ncbi:sigma-70 family RNA polymerase sigma factor [Clostridium sp.]|uniref:sigma-70 family RNA polymerase sigma factor n=1 Tax=Clostridium sp. TaxID=1506 RepID=UPI002615C3E3|nr:sigma-70 family RNA polymerase sigma factor [Clostridium sp.]
MNDFGKLVYYVAGNILKEDYEKDFIDECYNDVFTTIWFNIDCFDEEIIDNILNNLEEKDKVIFIKRYIEGYTIKEIAKELGYSENYIHTRISRTRKKLKNINKDVI